MYDPTCLINSLLSIIPDVRAKLDSLLSTALVIRELIQDHDGSVDRVFKDAIDCFLADYTAPRLENKVAFAQAVLSEETCTIRLTDLLGPHDDHCTFSVGVLFGNVTHVAYNPKRILSLAVVEVVYFDPETWLDSATPVYCAANLLVRYYVL